VFRVYKAHRVYKERRDSAFKVSRVYKALKALRV
jgi:hypothetical protein